VLLSSADFREAAVARASGKTGGRIEFGGTSTKTPSAPLNAEASDVANRRYRLYDFATALCPDIPFAMSRTHGRTGRRRRRLIRDAAQTLPVIPVLRTLCFLSCDHHGIVNVFPSA